MKGSANEGRALGAMIGGLAAGAALSAVMLLGERRSGKPSELIELERATAAKLDIATPTGAAPATITEQVVTHGGHLALSALAGLTYAAVVDEDADGPIAGAAFGAAFFAAAYGVAGPMLGVTPLPWRQPPLRAVQHPVVHMLFGLAIARLARRASDGRQIELLGGSVNVVYLRPAAIRGAGKSRPDRRTRQVERLR